MGDDHVRVSRNLAAAKSAGAAMWKPGSIFQWETISAQPVHRIFREGIAVERAMGGAVWSVRVANPWREDIWRFPEISQRHFAAFRAWLANEARSGLDDFTRVDETRAIARVRLLECDFVEEEKIPKTAALTLRLAILAEGACAS